MEASVSDKAITLAEATRLFPLACSTLAEAAREGRIVARKSGHTWLTTEEAVRDAIQRGALRPRRKG